MDRNQISEESNTLTLDQFGTIKQKEVNVVVVLDENNLANTLNVDTKIWEVSLEELLLDDLTTTHELLEELNFPGLHINGFYNFIKNSISSAKNAN